MNQIPMKIVIGCIREGRMIDAIKEFRVAYGGGLKEAKDAVEAIKAAMSADHNGRYMVFTRSHEHEARFAATASQCTSRAEAMRYAADVVNHRFETLVVRVLAESKPVTTRELKDVA